MSLQEPGPLGRKLGMQSNYLPQTDLLSLGPKIMNKRAALGVQRQTVTWAEVCEVVDKEKRLLEYNDGILQGECSGAFGN